MRLKIAAAAVDAALEILSDPELTHAPGRKHWAEARRLLVDVRGEILAGLDMWRMGYPAGLRENPARDSTRKETGSGTDTPRADVPISGR